HLLIKPAAVACFEPVEIGLAIRAEGEACKQRSSRNLGRPIACGGEPRIDAAASDLVENLLRSRPLARLLQVEHERSARALLDQFGKPRGRFAETGKMGSVNDGRDEGHGGGLGSARRPCCQQHQSEHGQRPCLHSSFALPSNSHFLSLAADATSWLPPLATRRETRQCYESCA